MLLVKWLQSHNWSCINVRMNKSPIERAISHAGSQSRLGRLAGVSQTAIWKLATGRTVRPSAELAVAIERATNGAVTRHDLRPDIYNPTDALPPELTKGEAA